MDDLAKFISISYKNSGADISENDAKLIMHSYKNKFYHIRENGEIKSVCFYVLINNEMLESIKKNPFVISQNNFIDTCNANIGKNLHFIGIASKGVKNILKILKTLVRKHNVESVSWYRNDMKELFIRNIKRSVICQCLG